MIPAGLSSSVVAMGEPHLDSDDRDEVVSLTQAAKAIRVTTKGAEAELNSGSLVAEETVGTGAPVALVYEFGKGVPAREKKKVGGGCYRVSTISVPISRS